jgi:hypothetical protein
VSQSANVHIRTNSVKQSVSSEAVTFHLVGMFLVFSGTRNSIGEISGSYGGEYERCAASPGTNLPTF